MKLINELSLEPGYSSSDLKAAILKKCQIKKNELISFEILKESIDSRKKPKISVKLNVAVEVEKNALGKLSKFDDVVVDHSGFDPQKLSFSAQSPVVVGFGPSGMFAALVLAKAGLKPIVIEQGKCVEERQRDVDEFWKNRTLNKFSNVQFGEGGAGTFSDGKLASNVNNAYTKKCINEFILAGAPAEIFYSFAPHIGSDKLKMVVINFRKQIESWGGKVLFNEHFYDFEAAEGGVKVFLENTLSGKHSKICASALILGVGHSAIDTYRLLDFKGVKMCQKPFAMGVRIEQLQEDINLAQYGAPNKFLPPANYKLVTHLPSGRSVFTFCMCPGGKVVASSSEEGTVVTNGMSNYARDGKNANSALLVNVSPSDFESDDVLAGAEFQHKYEKLSFELGGKNYNAPAETVRDFLDGKTQFDAGSGRVKATYAPSVTFADLSKCLPEFVTESLKQALPIFERKIKNFAKDDNLLIGVESRSSAPVQIFRDENFMTNVENLYVIGEGAGFAGGITSSAQDGAKCAEKVIENLKMKFQKN